MNRVTELTIIASPNEQPPVPSAGNDLEGGIARNNDLGGSGPVAFTAQNQVSEVQFLPQDLKKGRMVALTRMSTQEQISIIT